VDVVASETDSPTTAHISAAAAIHPLLLFASSRRSLAQRPSLGSAEGDASGDPSGEDTDEEAGGYGGGEAGGEGGTEPGPPGLPAAGGGKGPWGVVGL
jgi:hypothetical protein